MGYNVQMYEGELLFMGFHQGKAQNIVTFEANNVKRNKNL